MLSRPMDPQFPLGQDRPAPLPHHEILSHLFSSPRRPFKRARFACVIRGILLGLLATAAVSDGKGPLVHIVKARLQ